MTSFAYIQRQHRQFVKLAGGLGGKSPLEATALICEEIGELTHELRKNRLDAGKVANELADVILRTIDVALELDIDIEHAICSKVEANLNNVSERVVKDRRF